MSNKIDLTYKILNLLSDYSSEIRNLIIDNINELDKSDDLDSIVKKYLRNMEIEVETFIDDIITCIKKSHLKK